MPDLAGEPFHCCLCGAANVRCLCPGCNRRYALPDGTLPAWLRAVQRLAQRATKREARNQERQARGVRPNGRGRGGARYAPGLVFVSLERLSE